MSYKVYIYDRETNEALKIITIENDNIPNRAYVYNYAARWCTFQPGVYFTDKGDDIKITDLTEIIKI